MRCDMSVFQRRNGSPAKHLAQIRVRRLVLLISVVVAPLGLRGSPARAADAASDTAASADVQKSIRQAIDLLSVTSERERDKVKTAFDLIKAQPNHAALAELCNWLENEEATKRRSAVYLIGALSWKDASPAFSPLRELLKHQEQLTRGMAALTLGTLGDSASYEAIVHMAREDGDPYARRCAAWALGELRDGRALEPLQAIRADKDPNVAANATNAIDRLTFLRENEGASGDAKQVVRGIWLIAGSVPWDEQRLQRAFSMIQSCEPSVRKPILDKAASSPSTAIQNSVKLALKKIRETAKNESDAAAASKSK